MQHRRCLYQAKWHLLTFTAISGLNPSIFYSISVPASSYLADTLTRIGNFDGGDNWDKVG